MLINPSGISGEGWQPGKNICISIHVKGKENTKGERSDASLYIVREWA